MFDQLVDSLLLLKSRTDALAAVMAQKTTHKCNNVSVPRYHIFSHTRYDCLFPLSIPSLYLYSQICPAFFYRSRFGSQLYSNRSNQMLKQYVKFWVRCRNLQKVALFSGPQNFNNTLSSLSFAPTPSATTALLLCNRRLTLLLIFSLLYDRMNMMKCAEHGSPCYPVFRSHNAVSLCLSARDCLTTEIFIQVCSYLTDIYIPCTSYRIVKALRIIAAI